MGQRRKHSPEQAAELLRQIEEGIANGKTIAECCMEAQITKAMYWTWRREICGVQDVLRLRLKKLKQENASLKRLVSELCLQRQTLRDIIASRGL